MFKILCIVVIIIFSIFFISHVITERGHIIGEFVSGGHEGYGDFCGQYPSSWLLLKNYSIEGNIEDYYNGRFYFGNEYVDIDNCIVGQKYKFYYHKESRPSDTTSGDNIEYWVIDNIEKIN